MNFFVRRALHVVHGYNEPFLSLSNQYSRTLQSAGWHVTTVYLTGSESNEIRERTVADDVFFFDVSRKAMKGIKLGLIWKVRGLLQTGTFQLIVAQRYKSLYLALLGSIGSRVPVLGVSHAFGLLSLSGRRKLLGFFRRRLTLVGVSDAVASDMRAHAGDLQVVTLHNCIDAFAMDASMLSRDAARQQLGIATDEWVFGNVGRLHPDKDQGTIIRAFAGVSQQYPKAKLVLIGKGRCEKEYLQLVSQLQLQGRVVLTGAVVDAARLFRAFDVYVSASDREPFGIVLTEAMLAGIPVISTDCGGAPEVLGVHALYFSCGNVEQLQSHMAAMISMSLLERQSCGNRLRERLFDVFSSDVFAEKLNVIVKNLCHE